MAPDEGVVQGRVQPRAAACSSNPQSDHGGAGCAVSPRTTPGGEYSHICQYFPSGGLGTYEGQDIVGSAEDEVQPLWRYLRDESGATLAVAVGG